MKIFDILRKIRKDFSPYENSIEVLIFKDNLLHNLNEYKVFIRRKILANFS
jgi:hypothetical protein